MDCNRVVLCGQIAGKETLRYTPAGIPALDFRLSHDSEQMEAGGKRRIQCEVNVLALDQPALQASQLEVGSNVAVEGFLARRSRNSTHLVLHVQRLKIL